MANAKVIFKGHPFNPLTQLAEALNGKKFGSNVKLDNEMLDKLNRAIALDRLYFDNVGSGRFYRPLNDFSKIFDSSMPYKYRDWEDLVDRNDFEQFQKDITNEFPQRLGPYVHFSGQYAPSVNWVDVARNDENVRRNCIEAGEADYRNSNACNGAVRQWLEDNTTIEGAIPLLEDIAKYNAMKRVMSLGGSIERDNARLARINQKKPQEFANYFRRNAGTSLANAVNDAQHRLNVSWRDFNNQLIDIAERDGVFVDPMSFVDDYRYGNIAKAFINGDIDGVTRYTLETMPEIPERDRYKGQRSGSTEPNYYDIVRTLSGRSYGWSPFRNAIDKGIVDR